MIHLQIVAPAGSTPRVLESLHDTPAVTSIILVRGAGRRPEGDVILCDVAGEEASDVISDLRDLGIGRRGSIRVGPTTTEISSFVAKAERAAGGRSSDAVVWERVEEQTSESAELSGSFVTFMVVAVLIAAIGLYLDSAILIIGAMIVGPDFGPIAGFCVGATNLRPSQAGRSLLALFVGYALAILAAYLLTLVLTMAGLLPESFGSIERSVASLVLEPGFFTVVVALLAGTAGMLSLTTAKSGALVGVLVSVTTVPSAASVAAAGAYSRAGPFRESLLQLATNVGAMLAAGVATLAVLRVLYRYRRAAHLRTLARGLERIGASPFVAALILLAAVGAFAALVYFAVLPNIAQEVEVLTSDDGPNSLDAVAGALRDVPFAPGLDEVLERLESHLQGLIGSLPQILVAANETIAYAVTAVFLALYLAVSPGTYVRGMLRLVPVARREFAREFVDVLAGRLRGWVVGTGMVASFVAPRYRERRGILLRSYSKTREISRGRRPSSSRRHGGTYPLASGSGYGGIRRRRGPTRGDTYAPCHPVRGRPGLLLAHGQTSLFSVEAEGRAPSA